MNARPLDAELLHVLRGLAHSTRVVVELCRPAAGVAQPDLVPILDGSAATAAASVERAALLLEKLMGRERPLKIVLAEDDEAAMFFLRQTLAGVGHQIVGETAHAAGLTTLLRSIPDVDIAVFDVHLLGGSGLDALRAAGRAAGRSIPGVAVTGDDSRQLLMEATQDATVLSYVLKPFTPDQLIASVEIALATHRRLAQFAAAAGDRIAIEQAKARLMATLGLAEGEAHHFLVRESQRQRPAVTARVFAERILAGEVADADLRKSLQSHRVIEVAQETIVQRFGMPRDNAYEILRRLARRSGLTVEMFARDVQAGTARLPDQWPESA